MSIGTAKGIGVDEDMALVITNLYANPVGTVVKQLLNGVDSVSNDSN